MAGYARVSIFHVPYRLPVLTSQIKESGNNSGNTEISQSNIEGKSEDENQLLESFISPEIDSDFETDGGKAPYFEAGVETGPGGDLRLGSNTTEADRNIDDPVAGGSTDTGGDSSRRESSESFHTSRSSASGSSIDLELQRRRLTTRERVVNVFNHFVPIRQTYERISNGITTGRMQANVPGRFIGQGTDGVFRNLAAKPDTDAAIQEQELHPPTYEEAAADATPEYWESTVISPMYEDEVFVEGLPVGNVASFVWNGLVTVAFQYIGFVLCYLLHTSHAAKHGSRAGLGITLVLAGYGLVPSNFGHLDEVPKRYEPSNPNDFDIQKSSSINGEVDAYSAGMFKQNVGTTSSGLLAGTNNTPYFAYGIIAFGLFVIIKSLADFYRVKQMERVVLSPPGAIPTTTTTERTESTNTGE